MAEHELHRDERGASLVYDTGVGSTLTVYWHHGTPNLEAPPAPMPPVLESLRIRWISYERSGYGASSPQQRRDVASAAGYVEAVAEALGVETCQPR